MKSCEEIKREVLDTIREKVRTPSSMRFTPWETPHICIFQVGNNPASNAYVRGKMNDLKECCISVELRVFNDDISEQSLIKEVKGVCRDPYFTGVIVQMPLPSHISAANVVSAIPSNKDLDGFNPDSLYTSCTPAGIMKFFEVNDIDLTGKHCVIVNRSDIVGRPLVNLLLDKDATVTVCHSKTWDIPVYTRNADILITAVGKPDFITQPMVKKDSIIIDVGISHDAEGKMCGDVSRDVECYYKTPVPKGVGLLTRAMFAFNCYESGTHQSR